MVVPQLVEAVLVADVLGRVLVGHRVAEPLEPPHPRAWHLDERVHQVARRHVLLVVVPRRHLRAAAREGRLVLAGHLPRVERVRLRVDHAVQLALDRAAVLRRRLRRPVPPDAEVDLLAVDVHVLAVEEDRVRRPARAGEAAGEGDRRRRAARVVVGLARRLHHRAVVALDLERVVAAVRQDVDGLLRVEVGLGVVARLDVRVRPHPALARARRRLSAPVRRRALERVLERRARGEHPGAERLHILHDVHLGLEGLLLLEQRQADERGQEREDHRVACAIAPTAAPERAALPEAAIDGLGSRLILWGASYQHESRSRDSAVVREFTFGGYSAVRLYTQIYPAPLSRRGG